MLVAAGNRHVLFLQGPGSMFFYRFALALRRSGITVSKIHLCLGDLVFWGKHDSTMFRQRFDDWASFIERYIVHNGVSDIVLFSDSRPYHRVAADIAKGLGVNIFVFENGYFRPDWITFERGGVNGRSSFPRNRAEIERIAAAIPDPGVEAKSIRFNRHLLLGDWAWHALNFLGAPMFPHFRRHRPAHPLRELWGATKKVLRWYPKHLRSKARFKAVLDSGRAYFFFPLQLDLDFQLAVDSPFASISAATDAVIASFARHAPADCLLLVKNHPHDSNLVDRERDTARIARHHGVADRVVFLETGTNPQILEHARAVVTINSTMGTSGLWHSLPVCALGRAIYDIEGLTHQGDLDQFWQAPTQPDMSFFRTFRRALIHATQVRGEFGSGRSGEPTFQECLYRLVVTPYRTAGLSLAAAGEGSVRDPMANRTFCEVTPNISSPIAPEIRTDPGRKPA
jgi:capsular polysaccharide export protein